MSVTTTKPPCSRAPRDLNKSTMANRRCALLNTWGGVSGVKQTVSLLANKEIPMDKIPFLFLSSIKSRIVKKKVLNCIVYCNLGEKRQRIDINVGDWQEVSSPKKYKRIELWAERWRLYFELEEGWGLGADAARSNLCAESAWPKL